MTKTVARDLLVRVLVDAGLDVEDGRDVRWDYSGRGMYGRVCFGFVGGPRDCARFFLTLGGVVEDAKAYAVDEVRHAWEDAAEALADDLMTDNMGYDTIFYFPSVEVVDFPRDDTSEVDGDPDVEHERRVDVELGVE